MASMAFVYHRTIHFGDTDAAGVVFFPNYLAICHEAYEESLAAAGLELKSFFGEHAVVVPVSKSRAGLPPPACLWRQGRASCSRRPVGAGQFLPQLRIAPSRFSAKARREGAHRTRLHLVRHPRTPCSPPRDRSLDQSPLCLNQDRALLWLADGNQHPNQTNMGTTNHRRVEPASHAMASPSRRAFFGFFAACILICASAPAAESNIDSLRTSAEKGDPMAQYGLGMVYARGSGVPANSEEAFKWLRKSATQGNAFAQSYIGVMYAAGEGVGKDLGEAVKWYRKAAEQGDADAQCNLGVSYSLGQGVARDLVEARKWLRKAADQGHPTALFNLGDMYCSGTGVKKDLAEAAKWYRMAAEQGDTDAQFNLGMMYATGQGVKKDEVEALAWRNICANSGDKEAVRNREVLERRLGERKVLQAQRRSMQIVQLIDQNKAARAADPVTVP